MVINEGIKRSGLDEDGKRMKDPAPVDCPDTKCNCLECSIDNKTDTYFCNHIPKDDSKVL